MNRRHLLASATALLAVPHVARASGQQIKLGHNNTVNSIIHAAAVEMDRALKERSGGRLSLDIHPNATLGSEAQMVAAVGNGSLDMTLAPIGSISSLSAEIGLSEVPYIFRDAAHARASLDGQLGQAFDELLRARNVRAIGWSEVGMRHITANRPVRNAEDLRGLKLRLPISPAMLEGFRAMGAAANILPFPQLSEALRSGQFDGQEVPVSIFVASGLRPFQSHLTLTGHVYAGCGFLIGSDALAELNAADQALVRGAAQHAAVASRVLSDRLEADGVAELRRSGMTIVQDVDLRSFLRASEAASPALASAFGAEAIGRIRRLAA